ncbi:hypothetical protein ROTAS13_04649 [Roseomonas sp. TAS13]|nr:hypothetical protein ROTAS13_04649 [Roseomonas sp. TAS13]
MGGVEWRAGAGFEAHGHQQPVAEAGREGQGAAGDAFAQGGVVPVHRHAGAEGGLREGQGRGDDGEGVALLEEPGGAVVPPGGGAGGGGEAQPGEARQDVAGQAGGPGDEAGAGGGGDQAAPSLGRDFLRFLAAEARHAGLGPEAQALRPPSGEAFLPQVAADGAAQGGIGARIGAPPGRIGEPAGMLRAQGAVLGDPFGNDVEAKGQPLRAAGGGDAGQRLGAVLPGLQQRVRAVVVGNVKQVAGGAGGEDRRDGHAAKAQPGDAGQFRPPAAQGAKHQGVEVVEGRHGAAGQGDVMRGLGGGLVDVHGPGRVPLAGLRAVGPAAGSGGRRRSSQPPREWPSERTRNWS